MTGISMYEAKTLTVTAADHVAEITLTRPEVMNAFDAALHDDFLEALGVLREAGDVRAVVLASTGKAFSAGGDFDFMRQGHDDPVFLRRHMDVGRHLLYSLVDLPLPIVVALQGAAIGLGATVALACDCVVAARSAVLADPHVNIGLVAGDGGCLVWPAAMGLLRAKRYLLTVRSCHRPGRRTGRCPAGRPGAGRPYRRSPAAGGAGHETGPGQCHAGPGVGGGRLRLRAGDRLRRLRRPAGGGRRLQGTPPRRVPGPVTR